jgi:deazaflavin-dependent oxidoreductase (nitroreductase family)
VTERQELNQKIIEEFRANGGEVAQFTGTPLLLLISTGAKTGEIRTSPLAYLRDGDRLVVFAANGGRPTHPGWYHNVIGHPRVVVEAGDQRFEATATVATGEDRERLWVLHVERNSAFGDFAARTTRAIPVVVLTPDA